MSPKVLQGEKSNRAANVAKVPADVGDPIHGLDKVLQTSRKRCRFQEALAILPSRAFNFILHHARLQGLRQVGLMVECTLAAHIQNPTNVCNLRTIQKERRLARTRVRCDGFSRRRRQAAQTTKVFAFNCIPFLMNSRGHTVVQAEIGIPGRHRSGG